MAVYIKLTLQLRNNIITMSIKITTTVFINFLTIVIKQRRPILKQSSVVIKLRRLYIKDTTVIIKF